jgi:hypothetical protein
VLRDVERRDTGALLDEAPGDRGADPARPAGDEGDAPVETLLVHRDSISVSAVLRSTLPAGVSE